MAYNNTLPTGGYNPQMGAFPNMPQMGMGPLGMIPPMMMGMSQLARGGMGGQERQAPIGEPIFIDGVQQAYAMAMQPDTDKVFFDKEEPVFYCVSVDRMGIPTVKVYRFQEVPMHPPMGGAMSNFVTKEEIGQMIQAYIMATKGGSGDESDLLASNGAKK